MRLHWFYRFYKNKAIVSRSEHIRSQHDSTHLFLLLEVVKLQPTEGIEVNS